MVAASSLLTPSFTGFGAPSTRSLASFRPRLVTSRTALMVFTLFSPAAVRMTVNSVFSSTAAAAAPPAPGAAAATVAAAAETPNFSSMSLMSCESSRTDMLPIASRMSCLAIAMICLLLVSSRLCGMKSGSGRGLFLRVVNGGERAHEFSRHLVQRPHELGDGGLHRAHELREELLAAGQRCELSHLLCAHHLAGHRPALDDELFVPLRIGVEHLRGGHRVVGNA